MLRDKRRARLRRADAAALYFLRMTVAMRHYARLQRRESSAAIRAICFFTSLPSAV